MAFSRAFFGQGVGSIVLDQLGCAGTELRLFNCPRNPLGSHDCSHFEDAGVRCQNISTGVNNYCTCQRLACLNNHRCLANYVNTMYSSKKNILISGVGMGGGGGGGLRGLEPPLFLMEPPYFWFLSLYQKVFCAVN